MWDSFALAYIQAVCLVQAPRTSAAIAAQLPIVGNTAQSVLKTLASAALHALLLHLRRSAGHSLQGFLNSLKQRLAMNLSSVPSGGVTRMIPTWDTHAKPGRNLPLRHVGPMPTSIL